MLTSRLLRADEHDRFIAFTRQNKDMFSRQTNGISAASISVAYLQHADVHIFTRPNAPNRWVAGYAINTQAPFRYLGVLPGTSGSDVLRRHSLALEHLVEITLLIRARDIDWLSGERELYYLQSILDALLTGRRVVLGGSVKEAHRQTQMKILDQPLYDGYLDIAGSPTRGWLYYATRWGVVRNVFRHLLSALWAYIKPGQRNRPKPSQADSDGQPKIPVPNN